MNQDINNKIFSGDNSNPFQVPEGYFDSFSERIMERIPQKEIQLSRSHKLIRSIKPILSIAASILIIFSIIYVPIKILGPKIIAQNKDQNELEYIDYYFANEYIDYDIYEGETDIETSDEAFIETMLLASVSEIELMELNQ